MPCPACGAPLKGAQTAACSATCRKRLQRDRDRARAARRGAELAALRAQVAALQAAADDR